MRIDVWPSRPLFFTGAIAGSLALCLTASGGDPPMAKVVPIPPGREESMRVLGGPPATVTMRSGYVVLAPGDSVGRHNTDTYEEAVVVLSGSGELRSPGGPVLALQAPCVAYCPPRTEHDVVNTGEEPLRYVYVVAKTPAADETR